MDIHDIRRENLCVLIERYGSQRKVADMLDIEPSFISQIKTGVRNMGERFARDIEEKLRLEPGQMDQAGAGEGRDLTVLRDIILTALTAAKGTGAPDQLVARVCVAAWQVFLETGEAPDSAQALRLYVLMGEDD